MIETNNPPPSDPILCRNDNGRISLIETRRSCAKPDHFLCRNDNGRISLISIMKKYGLTSCPKTCLAVGPMRMNSLHRKCRNCPIPECPPDGCSFQPELNKLRFVKERVIYSYSFAGTSVNTFRGTTRLEYGLRLTPLMFFRF